MRIRTSLRDLVHDERGYGMIEYVLIVVFAAFTSVVVMPKATSSIHKIFAKLEALMGGVGYTATSAFPPIDTVIRVICAILAVGLLSLILHRRSQAAMDE